MPKLRTIYKSFLIALLVIGIVSISILTKAKPQGGNIQEGDITIISNSGNAIDTLITQQSQKGIIHWQSFNIGETEHTHFAQPNVSAVTLNRILGGDSSSILGKLSATGQIFIINPSGILFGPDAYVDVSSLLATTSNITNKDFLAGNYYFVQGPNNNAKVINQGYIKVADSGLVFLTAPSVENAGLIEARLGKVALGSTPTNSAYILDFYGDQLLQFVIPSDVESNIDTAITQSGKIVAHGGTVLLTADTAKSIVDKSINMSGIIEADTISNKGGKIILSGGEKGVVSVTGKIHARGDEPSEVGGKVKITGEKVGLFTNSLIDVSGTAGGGEVLIGADYLDDIFVPTTRFTYVDPNATIFADATTIGKGGEIIVWSDEATGFYGKAFARGGPLGGDGGFVETSSKGGLDVQGSIIDLSAENGDFGLWLLDPRNVTIVPAGTIGGWWSNFPNWGTWSPVWNNATLDVIQIGAALLIADVEINTGTTGSQPGYIFWLFLANLDFLGLLPRTLTLDAANSIFIDGGISGINLNLVLKAPGSIFIGNTSYIGDLLGLFGLRSLDFTSSFINLGSIYNITTQGSQNYSGHVKLNNNINLVSLAGGDINFYDTINNDYNLNINTSGTINFLDNIGDINPLNELTIINADEVFIAANQIKTDEDQEYNAPVLLFNDIKLETTNSGGDIFFADTVKAFGGSSKNLDIDTQGNVTFNAPIGTLGDLTIDSNSTILNTNTITTSGLQLYESPVTLAGTGTVNFTTSNDPITFLSTIQGSGKNINLSSGSGTTTLSGIQNIGNLKLLSSGNKYLTGNISNAGSLGIASGGTTTINANNITTTGSQKYQNPVNLTGSSPKTFVGGIIEFLANLTGSGQDATINSGAQKTQLSTVNNLGNLALTGTGNKTLAGDITNTTSLDIAAGSTTTISANNITTTGSQKYQGNVVLSGSSPKSFAGNIIDFLANLVGSGQDVTVDSGSGTTTINTVNNLGNLQLTGTGNKTLAGNISGTTSLDVASGGTTTINTPSITTTGTQTYNPPIILGANTLLTTTLSGDIVFVDTINGGFGLTTNAQGDVIFNGTIGSTTPYLTYLTADATGNIILNTSSITTTGTQTYNAPIILGSNILLKTDTAGNIIFVNTINGGVELTIDAKGNITFGNSIGNTNILDQLIATATLDINSNAPQIRTTGIQTYNSPITLGANTLLQTTSGPLANVTFANTIDGGYGLTIDAQGNIIFNEAVGRTTPLSFLDLTGTGGINLNASIGMPLFDPSIETIGNQTYRSPVTFNTDTFLLTTGTTGNIIFVDKLEGPGGLFAGSILGNITFNNTIGNITPLSGLIIEATDGININTDTIKTTNSQDYRSNVTLGGTSPTKFENINSSIRFLNSITGSGQDVELESSLSIIELEGDISGVATLNMIGNTINISSPSITTTGTQTYSAPVFLGENTILTTTSAGNIVFANTIDGTGGLTINVQGDVSFGDVIGSIIPVSYLDITITSSGININIPQIITSGNQIYSAPIILETDTTMTAGGDVHFQHTIDSLSTPDPKNLTVSTPGTTTFDDQVGGTKQLKSITTDAGGTTVINGGLMSTTEAQKYYDTVILGADTTFEASNIEFLNTLGSDSSLTSRTPTIDVTGDITISGSGPVNALTQLLITPGAPGSVIYLGANPITTIGPQEYQRPALLTADTTLNSLTNIEFTNTIDSVGSTPYSLTINTDLDTIFRDTIGGINPLQNLTTDSLGRTFLYGQEIFTEGWQNFGDEVILKTNNITLDAKGGITFGSTIIGPFNLILNAHNSNILFEGDVGTPDHLNPTPPPLNIPGIAPIGALQILEAYDVIANGGIYVTAFVQDGGSGTTAFNNILFAGAPGDVNFGTGPAFITTNNVTGNINIGSLYLDTNLANLTGYIGAIGGIGNVNVEKITIPETRLINIRPATYFINTIDLFTLFSQLSIISNLATPDALDSILESLKNNYNFGFGYEFLNIGDSEFDYLLLIDPLECEIVET